MKCWLIFCLSN